MIHGMTQEQTEIGTLREVDGILYRRGDVANRVWRIERGIVLLARPRLHSPGEAQPRHPLRIFAARQAGEYVGIEREAPARHDHGARVLGNALVLEMSYEEFHRACQQRGVAVAAALASQLARAYPRDGGEGTTQQRLAAWLHEHAGTELIGLPRGIIADLVGIAPETVSREIAALARLGAVRADRRSLDLLDLDVLGDLAGMPR